jgi:GTP-binding protein
MKIITAEFVTSAVSARQYPVLDHPEIAFIGRSNVGKSSLINSLLNRKKLVKMSSTPGKTQMINFFNINNALVFADLPGYGFAKVPAKVKKTWERMIEQYLTERQELKSVVLIVDIRRRPTDLDLAMQEWLDTQGLNYVLVVTKSDKLKQAECSRQLKAIKAAFFKEETGGRAEVIAYSSKTSKGRKELWSALRKRIDSDASC